MKYLLSRNEWKSNLEFLIESVISLDEDIKNILKYYASGQNTDNENFIQIAKVISSAIGRDIPQNKYDFIKRQPGDPNKFNVQMGKQSNPQTVAKVIRNLLISLGTPIGGENPIKDDTIQKFADELIGKFKIIDFKQQEQQKPEFEIKLVSGDQIPYWYKSENTHQIIGTELYNSCMKGDSKSDYINFYAKNPNQINLLVKIKDGRLEARALVFKLSHSTEGNDYFLERCYFNELPDRDLLFEWLKNHYSDKKILRKIDKFTTIEDKMICKLDNVLVDGYPYLDTLKYLGIKKDDEGKLTNEGFISNYDTRMDKMWDEKNYYVDNISVFEIQNTSGEREPLRSSERTFTFSVFHGFTPKFEYLADLWKSKPLGTYKCSQKIHQNTFENEGIMFKMESNVSQQRVNELISDRNYVEAGDFNVCHPDHVQRDLLSGPGDDTKLKYGCVAVFDITDLYKKDIKIKTKFDGLKEIGIKKLLMETSAWSFDHYQMFENEKLYLDEPTLNLIGLKKVTEERPQELMWFDDLNVTSRMQGRGNFILSKLFDIKPSDPMMKLRNFKDDPSDDVTMIGDDEYLDEWIKS